MSDGKSGSGFNLSRRKVLSGTTAAVTGSFAGCSGDEGSSQDPNSPGSDGDSVDDGSSNGNGNAGSGDFEPEFGELNIQQNYVNGDTAVFFDEESSLVTGENVSESELVLQYGDVTENFDLSEFSGEYTFESAGEGEAFIRAESEDGETATSETEEFFVEEPSIDAMLEGEDQVVLEAEGSSETVEYSVESNVGQEEVDSNIKFIKNGEEISTEGIINEDGTISIDYDQLISQVGTGEYQIQINASARGKTDTETINLELGQITAAEASRQRILENLGRMPAEIETQWTISDAKTVRELPPEDVEHASNIGYRMTGIPRDLKAVSEPGNLDLDQSLEADYLETPYQNINVHARSGFSYMVSTFESLDYDRLQDRNLSFYEEERMVEIPDGRELPLYKLDGEGFATKKWRIIDEENDVIFTWGADEVDEHVPDGSDKPIWRHGLEAAYGEGESFRDKYSFEDSELLEDQRTIMVNKNPAITPNNSKYDRFDLPSVDGKAGVIQTYDGGDTVTEHAVSVGSADEEPESYNSRETATEFIKKNWAGK
jgi:hypothetical protein